ncbi:MAG: DUF374 domain-containing protein [Rhodospirillales bacterium]|jgi:lysophospholipid acyltransferase (LPLAT)-like uncharacterized protein|nr:DUF374 domain-containing protein [Rhodospirillales bacterium]
MMSRLLRQGWAQTALAVLVALYLRLALATIRWRLVGWENLAPHLGPEPGSGPVVAAFWHEMLPLMPALWQRVHASGARARVLVSRHRDGRFIGEVMRRFDLGLAHGSTGTKGRDRGGASAVRALVAVLAHGEHVVMTPDGPRGPRRQAAAGVAQIAALSGAPVMPCAAWITPRIRLPTWDGMVLPVPFARGVLVCGAPIRVGREAAAAELATIAAALADVSRIAGAPA